MCPPVRQNGGFLYTIRAKDAAAAASQAGALVQALQARTSFDRTTRGGLQPVGTIWIASYLHALPLQPPDRGAQVLSLGTAATLYAAVGTNRLDDALELAAPLNQGTPAPAVTGAWSAIESLLYHPSDIAACERMRRMLHAPRKELNDVRRVFVAAMRRFYRQRNIVTHSGHTNGVALDAALRTTTPLIGAGLDRLVHAKLTYGIDPLDLAARAENSLDLAGDPLGPHVTKLLD